jgi:sugar-specific transcriptional regulator TrmB
MLTTILEQQGFSSLEAKVYLATLELGQAPASQIARTIETDRTTVYSCLQTLIKKKIILTIVKNKLTYFSAVSPQKLVADAQSKVNALMDNLPELLTLSSAF